MYKPWGGRADLYRASLETFLMRWQKEVAPDAAEFHK
jgi:hypothetical protein